MAHDPRLIKHEETIADLKPSIPDWIKNLERPATPCVVPAFGPLEGIRVVSTGQLIWRSTWKRVATHAPNEYPTGLPIT